jgi:regulator of sirC expression with transglutaminase-like and TPR domain
MSEDFEKRNKIALFSVKKKEKEEAEIQEELDLIEKVISDVETNIRQVFTNEVNFRTLLQVLYDRNIISEEEILAKYDQVVREVIHDRLHQFGFEINDEEKDD